MADLPALSTLRTLLAYDPDTGSLVWLVHTGRSSPGKPAGALNEQGYVIVTIDGRRVRGHRIAWALTHGAWPAREIDHINGVRSDNRLSNLREATPQQNKRNMRLLDRNTSGVKGVSFNKARRKWVAYVVLGRKHVHLGSFASRDEAEKARTHAAKHLYEDYYRHA